MAFALPPRRLEKRHNTIPHHSRFILTRNDPLPPLKQSDQLFDRAIKCHSVITSPSPHHLHLEAYDKNYENNTDRFLKQEAIPVAPSLPMRPGVKQKVVITKPKSMEERPINIAATKAALELMKKEKIRIKNKNALTDENGNLKEIDPVWLEPMPRI